MAPGLRSGRTGHPKVLGDGGEESGGCSAQRRDSGGEGRCLRSRWRAGAAGMIANCLLTVGMLLLLVRCALAAEGKHTAAIWPKETHADVLHLPVLPHYASLRVTSNISGGKKKKIDPLFHTGCVL